MQEDKSPRAPDETKLDFYNELVRILGPATDGSADLTNPRMLDKLMDIIVLAAENSADLTQAADLCLKAKRSDLAVYLYVKAVEKEPENLDLKMQVANLCMEAHRYEEALSLLKDICRTDLPPALSPAWTKRLITCYRALGLHREVTPLVEKMVKSNPDDEVARILQAGNYVHLKEWDKALEVIKAELDKNPGSAIFQGGLLTIYKNTAQPDEGRKQARAFLASYPTANMHIWCASFSLDLRDYDSMYQSLEKAISSANNLSGKNAAEDRNKIWRSVFSIRAAACSQQEDYQASVDAAERALGYGPMTDTEYLGLYNLISDNHVRLGNYKEAQQATEMALVFHPTDRVNLINHMYFCEETGDIASYLSSVAFFSRMDAEALHQYVEDVKEKTSGAVTQVGRPILLKPQPDGEAPYEFVEGVETGASPHLIRPLLLEASIDLKLTADGRVKVIEINDMYMSGYKGFFRAYQTNMREDLVFPFHDDLAAKMSERYGTEVSIIKPDHHKLRANYYARTELEPGGMMYSGTLPWWAANEYKDFLYFNTPGKLHHMYPETLVMSRNESYTPSQIRRLAGRILDSGSGPNRQFIIKPCDDSIGRGVELIPEARLMDEITKIVKWSAPEGEYWHDHIYPNFIVQECIRSRPVEAENGKLYDGTMRVAFSAVISPDRKSVEDIRFHGGYWKLPSKPFDDSDGRNAIVSFPPSSLSKIADEAFRAEIPVSARVRDDEYALVTSQLDKWLNGILPGFAQSSQGFRRNVLCLMDDRRFAVQNLGFELATHFQTTAVLETLHGGLNLIPIKSRLAELFDNQARRGHAARRYLKAITEDPLASIEQAKAIGSRSYPIIERRAQTLEIPDSDNKPYLQVRKAIAPQLFSAR